jgi:hypothetical protein
MYMEDDDLCYRAHTAGYVTLIASQVPIVHLQGQSIKKNRERKQLYYRSQVYYWQKHYGYLPTLAMRLLRWPIKMIKG